MPLVCTLFPCNRSVNRKRFATATALRAHIGMVHRGKWRVMGLKLPTDAEVEEAIRASVVNTQ